MRDFLKDIEYGKIGEQIFKEDFLDFLDIKYKDVTGCQQFQVIDTDYLTSVGKYEIKTNYRDNGILYIEEYTNVEPEYGNISLGWIYKTSADLIVFVSKKTRSMIFLPFNDRFKAYYSHIRENTDLIRNRVTHYNNNSWQSAYRPVPFELLNGYISVYKKK